MLTRSSQTVMTYCFLAQWAARTHLIVSGAFLFFSLLASPCMLSGQEHEDFDAHRFKVMGYWWFARPVGSFQGKVGPGSFPVDSSTGFVDYSTFAGRLDWKFKRKHHLLFDVSPTSTLKSIVLTKTIVFQGATYSGGTAVSIGMKTLSFSPGYQWDFVRRRRGHLGLVAQVNLLDLRGHINGAAQVSGPGGTRTASVNSSASIFVPLPVVGPDFRLCFLPHSDRWYLYGFLKGLYFFGYGDFISTRTTAGARLTHHLDVDFGYQLGSRLLIDTGSARVRLSQRGPIAGLQSHW